jgi:hypothetical protein
MAIVQRSSPSFIIGIDPGSTNCAYAIVGATTKTLEAAGKIRCTGTTARLLTRDAARWVRQQRFKYVGSPLKLRVEHQMRRKYQIQAAAFVGAGHALGMDSDYVHPSSVKRYWGLPLDGHAQNKRNAVLKVNALMSNDPDPKWKTKLQDDHICDAILTALAEL